jgi:hypothetical protein
MAISQVATAPSITPYILGLPTLNPDGALISGTPRRCKHPERGESEGRRETEDRRRATEEMRGGSESDNDFRQ